MSIKECELLKKNNLMDVVTWTCMIQAYIKNSVETLDPLDEEHGLCKAVMLYEEMKHKLYPNEITYSVLLFGCGEYLASSIGLKIIEDIKLRKMDSREEVVSAMIYFYGRVGLHETALQLFNELVRQFDQSKRVLSTITYNNMLSCYAQHGMGSQALSLYYDMVEKKVEFTEISIITLLNTFSHCGMIEDAIELYRNLKERHDFNPSTMIDCIMVDAFARSGRFEEAIQLINIRNDLDLWGALMGGCRKFNNIELGEEIFKKMTSIDEQNAAPYILLSNIYTYHGMNEKADNLNILMRSRRIKKIPGVVYHEENGKIYKFISGSEDYEISEEVDKVRMEIYIKIIRAGFKPDLRCVTNPKLTTNEEKEAALLRHAEKSAIAHAFVLNPNRKSILLLTKNLRICEDCHTTMEFISKVKQVEIIIRDANRYHHFKDGNCSCGRYW